MEKNGIGLLQNIYEKFFCPEGRLSRRYFLMMIAGFLLSFVLLLGLLVAAKETDSTVIGIISFIFVFIIVLMFLLLKYVYELRRWHDIGHDEKTYLKVCIYPTIFLGVVRGVLVVLKSVEALYLLNFVSFIYVAGLVLYICCHSGDKEMTTYGPWESRNSLHPYIPERPTESIPFWGDRQVKCVN